MQRLVHGYRKSSLSRRTFRSMRRYLSALFMQFLSNIKLRPSFSSLHAGTIGYTTEVSFLAKVYANEVEAYLIRIIINQDKYSARYFK